MSEIEPVIIGTLREIPSNLPARSGITKVVAFAAPVLVGTIFQPAARDLLKSRFWWVRAVRQLRFG
ncbi:MAG: hypothetical protein KatS3mg101_0600 [Patescibacteria group bacterium]|nr:MAG: hypothetical protein KatS3mg101_0600 [Patescibacteria group bacterium]